MTCVRLLCGVAERQDLKLSTPRDRQEITEKEMRTAPSPMPVRNLVMSSAHKLACAAMGVSIVKSDHIHTPTSKTAFEE